MNRFLTTKKQISTLAEVNVIPLVDIVFTLLIIFMIIAPMIHRGIEVQVPESSVGSTLPDHDYHIISLELDGTLWFDNHSATLESLHEHLEPLSPDQTLYIQSDARAAYGDVVAVLAYLKERGFQRVGLLTTPRAADRP